MDWIHALHSLREIDKYNTLGIPINKDATKTIVETWMSHNKSNPVRNYTLIIENQLNNDFIGLFGIQLFDKKYSAAEVWYKIHPSFWNKGIATEVLKKTIEYCFKELRLHRIQAGCAIENIASIKVLEKVGMIREGRGRKILPLKSGWSDNFQYAILESDKPTLN